MFPASEQAVFAVALLAAATSEAAFVTFEAAGVDAAAIAPTRDVFRTAVGGGTVAGANGSFGGVRREINWDGVPDSLADPNPLPANFFNVNSPRGVVFNTPGVGVMVSANAGLGTPVLFGFPLDFAAFSPQRLFTALGSSVVDISFFVPGTATPATTTAFAAIFVDVETAGSTSVQFFDQGNSLLYSRDVLVAGNLGFSFLGALADAGEQIARVRLTSGNNPIISNGVLSSLSGDTVVMDDFIYGEPVPEPVSMGLLVLGAWGLMRRQRR